jgi:magnesium transporter
MEQEANEDLQQIVGSKFVDPIHTPFGLRIRLRLPWLLLTLSGELVIALVIAKVFRATLEKAAVLAAFMPAIMATGGNVGLQSTTLVIRSLATGRLKPRHAMRLVLGELRLGVVLGLACGVMAGGAAYLINWGQVEAFRVGVSVLLALLSATLATSLAGTAVPILLHRMKLDPAMACGPFVTLFNDMFGSLVYLFIAMLLFSA